MKQSSQAAGVATMVLSSLLFTTSDICIKVLAEGLSPWQITAGRGLLGLALVVALTGFNPRPFLIRQWPVQLGLGAAGALGFTCFIVSIKYLPLSIAMPLAYVFPAIGAFLSPLINKEKPNRSDWLAIALALAAVICLSRGAQEDQQASFFGFAFGLIGAFFVALMTNLARRQTRTVSLRANMFYLCLGNIAICLPLVFLLDAPVVPVPRDLGRLFLVIAPASILGFILMFVAYRHLNAFRGATILMLEAALACVYGVAMLGEPLTGFMVTGGVLMMASALLISGYRLPSAGMVRGLNRLKRRNTSSS